MSTIVYHQQGNIQPCMEMTTTIKLKVTSGWSSFLQNLSNTDTSAAAAEKETAPYVHPMARLPSSSRLSDQSLALCTEPLGSETGSDMSGNNIFSPVFFTHEHTEEKMLSRLTSSTRSPEQKGPTGLECNPVSRTYSRSMKYKNSNNNNNNNFPPPLTTISGANSLRVRPHREGGRLVITAVETHPSKRSYLQAHRSNGRLRLCFVNDDSLANDHFDPQNTLGGEEENDYEINGGDEVDEGVEEYGEGEEEIGRDMDGNTFEVEVEMGMNKCLVGRCKEGGHSNKRFCHWGEPKPLWVTS